MRTLPLNYSDLSQLYTAEQQLTSLGAILERLELKHLSQFDTLRTLMHNNAVRLENSDGASGSDAVVQRGILLPAGIMDEAKITAKTSSALPLPQENTTRWVYVPQTEHQPNVDVLSVRLAPTKKWKFFTAGMCTMLAIGAATLWGWHVLQRPDPLQAQLAASLAPLPVILTPVQRDLLRQQAPDQAFITQTQQQLTRLDKLPPDWNIAYSRQLIEQAQVLWPEQAKPLVLEWHQQLNASALPKENLDGWHQGMTKLKQLSERLNRLDEQKGRYMTVSELKSAVFSAMQSFNQTIPAEEQLRVLSLTPAGQALSLADKTQLEMRLKQLITRYAEIKQTASEE